jgi:two-component system, NarL family, sensor histidine kinase DesK
MVLTLAPARLGPAALPGERGGSRVVSDESGAASAFARWSVVGVVALSLVSPVIAVSATALRGLLGQSPAAALALVAGALLLTPYLYLVTSAARGHRHPRAGWLAVAVAVPVLVVAPAVGTAWLPAFGALGLAVLLVLPPRWAAPVFVAVLVAPFPLATALDWPPDGLWGAVHVSKSLAVYALVRLSAAARQLEETRALLATDAIVQERLRIDEEMRRTVGADLAAIVEQGSRLSTAAAGTEVADQLTDLVGRSRATLARARRQVAGYRRQSLRTELDTAAALLRADGIPTRVLAPDHLPAGAEEVRERLRAETARLLRDGRRHGSCTITVTVDGGAVHLDVGTGAPGATTARSATTRTPA